MEKGKSVKVAPAVLVAYVRQLDASGLTASLDELTQGRDQCIVMPADLVEGVKKLFEDSASEAAMHTMKMTCGPMPCFPW